MDANLEHLTPEEQEALRATFQSQAGELLDAINEGLLQLEAGRTEPRLVQGIQRAMHTLKGDAGAFGLAGLVRLAHRMEDLLHAVAAGQATLDRDRLGLLFQAADACERMLQGEADAATTDPAIEALLESLAPPPIADCGLRIAECDLPAPDSAESAIGNRQSAIEELVLTEYEALAAADAESRGLTCYLVRAEVDPRCKMPGAGAFLVWRQLQGAAEIFRFDPSPEGQVPQGCREFTILLASAHDAQSLERRALLPGIVAAAHALPIAECGMRIAEPEAARQAEVRPQARPAPSHSDAANPQSAIRNPQSVLGASTILVDTRRIDKVMNLVGELVIARSMFHQAFADLQTRFPKADFLASFLEAQRLMDRSLGDLQKGVMKIRMVPIDRVFRRLPRLVRDLAEASGGRKAVRLALEGGATELDKGIVDALGEPLVHLLRNAVDHGIEPAAERQAQGKPAVGTVRVTARAEGNQIVIEVADDGRGIDPERIRRAALGHGLRTPQEVEALSDAQALDLIFCPGFTTAEEVTDTSGRGIGMDAVRAALEGLTGQISVTSRAGHGTTFTLRVPLTLAIIRAMRFRAAGRLFALPLSTIAEITRVEPAAVRTVDGHEVLPLRDRVISLVRLADALRIGEGGRGSGVGGRNGRNGEPSPAEATAPRPPAPEPHSAIRNPQSAIRNRLYVVVVALGEQRIGLVVDALQGEGELVIKALDVDWVSRAPIAGAAILGDGRVVLILDPAVLVDQVQRRARALRIADCGLRNAELGTSARRPEPEIGNPQSAIRNPPSGAEPAGARR